MVRPPFAKVPFDWTHRQPWVELPFPEAEYQQRLNSLRAGMAALGFDALLVYSNPWDHSNVRYLTNFDCYAGQALLVVPLDGDVVLCTDSVFHGEPMHTGVQLTWVRDVRAAHHPATVREPDSILDHVSDVLVERGLTGGRLGLTGDRILPAAFVDGLRQRLPIATFASASAILTRLRAIKSPRELELLRVAGRVGALGLETALVELRPGLSEHELAGRIHAAMMSAGAEGIRYPLTVVGGPRAGFKNVRPSPRAFQNGDMVFVDIGPLYQGYHCGCGVSAVVGAPTPEQRRLLRTAWEIRQTVLDTVRAGVRVGDLLAVVEPIVAREGYIDDYFPKGFGHGIGTAAGERPGLFPDSDERLEAGMTFCCEPMIVIEGLGTGVFKIMLAVHAEGVEELTASERNLAYYRALGVAD